MRKHYFLFTVLVMFVVQADAQWAQQFKAGNSTNFLNVITSGKYLVLVGDYTKTSSSPNIITVTKTTLNGEIVWTKNFGKNIQQNGFYIAETTDGGYVVAGIELKIDFGTFEPASTICLFKLTADGNLVWSRYLKYGNQDNTIANALTATADGGVLLGGSFTQRTQVGVVTYNYLAKISSTGAITWNKQFDAPGARRWITALFAAKDGYAVVSQSYTGSVTNQADAVNISLLDKSGSVSRSIQVGLKGVPVHFIQAACATDDKGIAIAGTAGSGPGNFDLWIVKINRELVVEWSNTIAINADDRPNNITQLPNGHLLLTGMVFDSSNAIRPLIAELDKSGKLLGTKSLGGNRDRGAFGTAVKGDSAFMLVNDQFGGGSRFSTLYGFTGLNTICSKTNITAGQQAANYLLINRRNVSAVDITTAVKAMPYSLTDLNLTASSICRVLPLQLTNFMAVSVSGGNQLRWTAAQQYNTVRFDIERYFNGEYIGIGSVAVQQNAPGGNYGFTDARPLAGANRYRLKIVDADGTFTHSFTAATEKELSPGAVTISPNPASAYALLRIRLSLPELVHFEVMNATGARLFARSFNSPVHIHDEKIDLQKFTPGVYFIRVTAGIKHYTLQFVKE